MSANPLQIELNNTDKASVLPWILALACAGCLIVLVSQLLNRIPASLLEQAIVEIDASKINGVQASVDGRDLHLNGTIDRGVSPALLKEKLANIEGVNNVIDSLTIIDPAQIAEQSAQLFQESLNSINTSAVAFQPGSVSFTSGSNQALQQLVAILKQHPESRIRIEGHTDNTGPAAVNLRVSRDRASAVANFLINNGISSDRLIVKGYGDSQPIDDNESESGRARNRRIEISYVY